MNYLSVPCFTCGELLIFATNGDVSEGSCLCDGVEHVCAA